MARIRTIKPEFFTSEDIVSLSPLGRLLYIALWCEADREGRFFWKPKTFKMRYFPADAIDINQHCDELVSGGLVVLYGDNLAHIPKFLDHQHVNPRETQSKLLEPNAIPTRESRVIDTTVTYREEGKGREPIYDTSKFEAFWDAYPKKKNKGEAEKAFKALKVSDDLMAAMTAALNVAKQSRDWLKDNGQFIPYPATWLRARGWEDQLESTGACSSEWGGAV